MRKKAKRTSTRRSLGGLSRLEICGRAHDVRSSGSRQNTRARDSVSKAGHGTVLKYCTERVDEEGATRLWRTRFAPRLVVAAELSLLKQAYPSAESRAMYVALPP
jgi:hypothetical protein